MLVLGGGFCDDEVRFRAGTGLGRARGNTLILFGRLWTGQMAKGHSAIEASRLTETLEMGLESTDTTEHWC